MATDDKLSGALQENILTLLVFNSEFCKLIRSIISPNLFESAIYREVCSHAIDFVQSTTSSCNGGRQKHSRM